MKSSYSFAVDAFSWGVISFEDQTFKTSHLELDYHSFYRLRPVNGSVIELFENAPFSKVRVWKDSNPYSIPIMTSSAREIQKLEKQHAKQHR